MVIDDDISKKPHMGVVVGGLKLRNPVMTASGTFGYGRELAPFVDLNRLGAVIAKGISLEPMKGNPPPRTAETPCGMLNAIGLENVGVKIFIDEKMPYLRGFDVSVVVNILGNKVEDYQRLAVQLEGVEGIDGLELNISCPNVKKGGIIFGTDPVAAAEVVREVRRACSLPLMVKLSPLVTDIATIARAVESEGADALSVGNTFPAMAVDVRSRRPRLANGTGGLSGPAIRPIMIRLVWLVAQAVAIPVVGVGGIMEAEDALEYIIAGATAVEVGTATFVQPRASLNILEGIERFLIQGGFEDIHELIGSIEM
jgi:dihydroorotate dehydrogenase (NAD+) catalytic subunit